MRHLNPCMKPIHEKIKTYASNNWIVLDVIIKHNIKIFEYYYK